VREPGDKRAVQSRLHPDDVGFHRLASEGFVRGHMHARGCLAEDPFVDSGDAAGRAAPQHPGALSYGVDGRDDGEAVTGPFEGGARLERSINLRRGDVGLPGRPRIDIGVQPPDRVQRRTDVGLLRARTGASPSTPVGMLMSPPHPRCRDHRDRTAKADDDRVAAAQRSRRLLPQPVPAQALPHQARDSHRPNSLSPRHERELGCAVSCVLPGWL